MSDNEKITLEFLAKQQMRILSELSEMRKETVRIPQIERDLAELKAGQASLSVGQAALSVDLKITKADVAEIKDTLPLIAGRLVRIEKQLGFVKA